MGGSGDGWSVSTVTTLNSVVDGRARPAVADGLHGVADQQALGVAEADGQLEVVAGRAHRGGHAVAVEADLQRLLDDDPSGNRLLVVAGVAGGHHLLGAAACHRRKDTGPRWPDSDDVDSAHGGRRGVPVAVPAVPSAAVRRGARARTTSPSRCATPCATGASATPTCSADRGAPARPPRRASWPRRSTASSPTRRRAVRHLRELPWRSSTGSSLDVQELDAASNNGVDAIRDLVSRVALATPGRWKVYIVDEVHMLSTPASNALLKTLEEPPAHVVFVLATTDPQKVLPTIRSRTQHYEFRLMSAEVLDELVRDVAGQAGIEVDDDAVDVVARRGDGSARDTLSALDQVAAVGRRRRGRSRSGRRGRRRRWRRTTPGRRWSRWRVRLNAGRDARRLGEAVLARLRIGFLALMAPDLVRRRARRRDRGPRQTTRRRPASRARSKSSATRSRR